MAGSDTLKRAWVGPTAYLNSQQARFAEFKHALVGKVIAGTEGYFVTIVLLEHAGQRRPLYYFPQQSLPPSSCRDAL